MSHFRFCNNGSLLQSFLYAFRRGAGPCSQWRGVCNSEVFAGRELIVGVLELRVDCKKLSAFFHKLTVRESPVTAVKIFIACRAKTVETAFFIQSSFGNVYRAHLKENFEIQHLLLEWIGERS